MAHKTLQKLAEELKEASDKLGIGGLYCHYKNPDHPYRVVDIVILEATDEVGVVYAPEENSAVKFVRPISSWLETVKLDDKSVPRFQLATNN